MLLTCGAKLNLRCKNEKTALDIAYEWGNTDIIDLITHTISGMPFNTFFYKESKITAMFHYILGALFSRYSIVLKEHFFQNGICRKSDKRVLKEREVVEKQKTN